MCESLSNTDRKRSIEELKARIASDRSKLNELIEDCPHDDIKGKKGMSAVCSTCDTNLGWWCPMSPDHTCDYEQDDGEYDEDSCRYCGHPEERK